MLVHVLAVMATAAWGPGVSRLRTLSLGEWRTALAAALLLPGMGVALEMWGLGRVQDVLAARLPDARVADPPAVTEARNVGRLVVAVGRRWPWRANCLRRSVVVWWLLRRRGIAADIRIGVRPARNVPDFHAWVEVAGEVVNDRPDIGAEFAAFDRPIAPPGAEFR